MNRRHFLMSSVAAGTAAVRSSSLASPNDTVRVACVGVRGQGRAHISHYAKMNNVEIAAICDIDESVLNPQLAAPAPVGIASNTIQSVDAAAGSWVRQQHSANGADFDYSETLVANNPRDGYAFRPAAATTAVGGTPVQIREFDTLVLRGMGFSAVAIPSNKSFSFSVNQP